MLRSTSDSTVRELLGFLLETRRPDGGWPYYAGKSSRLEPTCWALLALGAAGASISDAPLASWPRQEGLFLDRSGGDVNIGFNGLAAVVLASQGTRDDALIEGLLGVPGVQLPESQVNRQDNSLRGWPWVDGTFSWVEPTAWAVVGLKKLTASGRSSPMAERLEEAERMLADRVCQEGGWNYGNSNMLGSELEPHVPTSALGLIALRDQPDLPAVVKTLDWLQANRLRERSAMALGLTRIALGLFDRPVDDLAQALEAEWRDSRYLGNVHVTGIALYALAASETGYEAFRV